MNIYLCLCIETYTAIHVPLIVNTNISKVKTEGFLIYVNFGGLGMKLVNPYIPDDWFDKGIRHACEIYKSIEMCESTQCRTCYAPRVDCGYRGYCNPFIALCKEWRLADEIG